MHFMSDDFCIYASLPSLSLAPQVTFAGRLPDRPSFPSFPLYPLPPMPYSIHHSIWSLSLSPAFEKKDQAQTETSIGPSNSAKSHIREDALFHSQGLMLANRFLLKLTSSEAAFVDWSLPTGRSS